MSPTTRLTSTLPLVTAVALLGALAVLASGTTVPGAVLLAALALRERPARAGGRRRAA